MLLFLVLYDCSLSGSTVEEEKHWGHFCLPDSDRMSNMDYTYCKTEIVATRFLPIHNDDENVTNLT